MFNFENPEHISLIMDSLTDILKQRQNPAHKINENVYDKLYIQKQKEAIGRLITPCNSSNIFSRYIQKYER